MKLTSLGIAGVLACLILPAGCGSNAGDEDFESIEQEARPARRSRLLVPDAYATVQAAIDAARPGDLIQVRPGTYPEQLSIDKDLEIEGSAATSCSTVTMAAAR